MPQLTPVWREYAIGMPIAGMSTTAVAREVNVNLSTMSHLQRRFREFGSMSNRPHNRRPRVWVRVGERFADVNVVSRVPHVVGAFMVWEGIRYGQRKLFSSMAI